MDKILLTAGAIVAALLLFGGNDGLVNPREEPTTATDNHDADAGQSAGQFTTSRAPDGHFYADVRINDTPVRMLIDTGASSVVLSRRDARRIGIDSSPHEFTVQANTAGGIINLKPVTLNSMAIGSLSRHNIPALIAEHDLGISLIGQSFLEQVNSVEIASDQIRLR